MLKLSHDRTTVRRGFTIVELLVVIVVIAVLATISRMTYVGVMDRVNATNLQREIRASAKNIGLYHAETGAYPSLSTPNNPTSLITVPARMINDMAYCSKGTDYILFVKDLKGKIYYIENGGQIALTNSGGQGACASKGYSYQAWGNTLGNIFSENYQQACAGDGGTCNVGASPKTVAYGNNGLFIYKRGLTGSVGCGWTTFGSDPANGVNKACYIVGD